MGACCGKARAAALSSATSSCDPVQRRAPHWRSPTASATRMPAPSRHARSVSLSKASPCRMGQVLSHSALL
eukprot:3439074-Pyramimonas_sp.AAC.1